MNACINAGSELSRLVMATRCRWWDTLRLRATWRLCRLCRLCNAFKCAQQHGAITIKNNMNRRPGARTHSKCTELQPKAEKETNTLVTMLSYAPKAKANDPLSSHWPFAQAMQYKANNTPNCSTCIGMWTIDACVYAYVCLQLAFPPASCGMGSF